MTPKRRIKTKAIGIVVTAGCDADVDFHSILICNANNVTIVSEVV